ncbi:hypothetical protein IZY60_12790 [Lutibacter sp. B2]|nr:hypothetical protein [Lutibacter sp. B2]
MTNQKVLIKKLVSTYTELGQLLHKRIRSGEETDQELKVISDQICLLEKQIHDNGENVIPGKEEGKCPKCSKEFMSETVFCGECGFNIREFYEREIEHCQVCNGFISKGTNYCGICGSKLAQKSYLEKE